MSVLQRCEGRCEGIRKTYALTLVIKAVDKDSVMIPQINVPCNGKHRAIHERNKCRIHSPMPERLALGWQQHRDTRRLQRVSDNNT